VSETVVDILQICFSDWTLAAIVTRMQFYAYEIARNKRGLNDWIYEKAKEEEAKEVST
jgi:hypothetical protein